jgi:hypothetical protein
MYLVLPKNTAVFLAPQHELLVANFTGDNIAGFEILSDGSVSSTPGRMIRGNKTGLDDPVDVAVGGENGTIYVVNQSLSAGTPSITLYARNANGNVAPLQTITHPLLQRPVGIAVHQWPAEAAIVWVANQTIPSIGSNESGIIQFLLSHNVVAIPSHVIKLFSTAPDEPAHVAHRVPSDFLFTAVGQSNRIELAAEEYWMPTPPFATLSGSNTLLFDPIRVALDEEGNLYVLNRGGNVKRITIYDGVAANPFPSINVAPARTVLHNDPPWNLLDPNAIAVSANGHRLFIIDNHRIVVAERSSTSADFVHGQEIPKVQISGQLDSLDGPRGIAVRCDAPAC